MDAHVDAFTLDVNEFDDAAVGIVWPAARVLLHWLRTRLNNELGASISLEGATVLELGAGTAFLALGLVKTTGVAKVFAIEGDGLAMQNMRRNVECHECLGRVQPVWWNWEHGREVPSEIPLEEVDLIVGSDLVYPSYYCDAALVRVIDDLLNNVRLRKSAKLVLLLADRAIESHSISTPRSLDTFLEACASSNLLVQELALFKDDLEAVLGPLDGRSTHDDPGGASGTITRLRLFELRCQGRSVT